MIILITLDLWLGMKDISNTKHVKKDIWRIIVFRMVSKKSVGLLHVPRWKKDVESFLTDEK